VIFIVEQGLFVLPIRSKAIFSLKDFRSLTATSFLQFIQLLIRLGRNAGAETGKSSNRRADGRPHFQAPQFVDLQISW